MDDRLCFVQFLHPGSEHPPGDGRIRGWTSGPHARKFLLNSGRFLDDGEPRRGQLAFWGEWEAQSEMVATIDDPLLDGPRWLYWPFAVPPPSYRGLQNTDPFVFGDRFHYTGCLQHTKHGPTQMRNLARGSVVLFGSCRRSRFVIDTVLVVDRHIDHCMHDYRAKLRGHVSAAYEAVTLAPWYANMRERDRVHRLYFGATFDAPVDGMFSFFPCIPYEVGTRGFIRPEVHIPGVITPTMSQNKKLNIRTSTNEIRALWNEVVRQVSGQGLRLGIGADLPPMGREPSISPVV